MSWHCAMMAGWQNRIMLMEARMQGPAIFGFASSSPDATCPPHPREDLIDPIDMGADHAPALVHGRLDHAVHFRLARPPARTCRRSWCAGGRLTARRPAGRHAMAAILARTAAVTRSATAWLIDCPLSCFTLGERPGRAWSRSA
jgi:hypothetical protein